MIIGDERSLRAMDRMIALKPEWFQTHLAFALWEAWGGWNAAGRTGDPHPAWQWAKVVSTLILNIPPDLNPMLNTAM